MHIKQGIDVIHVSLNNINKFKFKSLQNKFQGEESTIYVHHLSTLQKSYNELTMTSKKRLADLEMLQDFIQSATTELIWLNEKEEIEISRDWSSKSLNVTEIERYYEVRIVTCVIFSFVVGNDPRSNDSSHTALEAINSQKKKKLVPFDLVPAIGAKLFQITGKLCGKREII